MWIWIILNCILIVYALLLFIYRSYIKKSSRYVTIPYNTQKHHNSYLLDNENRISTSYIKLNTNVDQINANHPKEFM